VSENDKPKSFQEIITGDGFHYGGEAVTTRGIVPLESPDKCLALAEGLINDPRIAWVSITDNPGGAPMLPPDWLAGKMTQHADRLVLHLSCKDLNRNGLESTLWRYASEGFDNILALTGDYPITGYGGTSEPVFDLDSVSLIALMQSMNEGLKVPGRRGMMDTLPSTNFFIGCCVSPFKQNERELIPQYWKLVRKIKQGAGWIIPQLGYDMRKFNEIKLFLESKGLSTPIIGNVYLLTKFVAKLFNSGKLAGCVVSDELLEQANKYAAGEDKGRKFFRELAAKQLAVFKGLGFAAGYLGGMSKPETFFEIIDMAESYGENDWKDFLPEICYSLPGEFFLFEHDPKTGMSDPSSLNQDYVKSLTNRSKSKEVTLDYRISRIVHALAFERDKKLWGMMKKFFAWAEKSGEPNLIGRLSHWVENESKHMMYGCKDCGDCSLPDCAYLCPNASCSKCGRNGPCGGSRNGRCELDDKECIWARAYERLKSYAEEEGMLEGDPIFYNAELKNTSAWANTYLDRDHHAPKKNDEDK
jgi:methylenetetrahydrofolate reductase (NADPH)